MLHWLPVPQWIQYMLYLLVCKALHGLAPQYLTELCQPVSLASSESGLQSSMQGYLLVVPTSTNFRRWSFAVPSPAAWNQLLQQHGTSCRQTSGTVNHWSRSVGLETHLFVGSALTVIDKTSVDRCISQYVDNSHSCNGCDKPCYDSLEIVDVLKSLTTKGQGHYKMKRGVCPSICLSVCHVP